jgi:hypothetical protein
MTFSGRLHLLGATAFALAVAGCHAGDHESEKVALRATSAALTFDQADAFTWLASEQQDDGGYPPTPSSLATSFQATSEVLRALHAHGRASGESFQRGFAFVSAYPEHNTEFIGRTAAISALSGHPVSSLVTELFASQNADGGWGDRLGYGSSVLDTSFVLDALATAGYGAGPQVASAVGLVLQRQTSDGSWSDATATSTALLTARAILALAPFRGTFAGVGAAITAGQNQLLSHRNAEGLWGETFVDAQVLIAFAATLADITPVRASGTALRNRQLADGSFESDAYTTALVLQAVRALDARLGGSASDNASITGYVLRANSTEPIAGAVVTVAELAGVAVSTNADGYYVVPGLAAGSYTLTATKAGFTSAGASVQTIGGSVTLAPQLVLAVAANTGVLRGLVFDSATQAPLAGVQVSIAGPSARSVLTTISGEFDFGSTAPGPYTLSFAKNGYLSVSGTATVVAGEVLVAQLGLTLSGGFVDSAPVQIRGRVVNGVSGDPISGAIIVLAPNLTATSDAGGAFVVANVPRGDYRGTVTATGYRGVTFSLVLPPGAAGALGEIALFPASTQQAPTSLALHGTVVDGISGLPVPAALVTLVETGATTSSGAAGEFTFSGVTLMSFELRVSAPGYIAGSYALRVSAFGEANVVLRIAPPGSGALTSAFSGQVTNTATAAPVAGAEIRVAGTNLATTTDGTGHFTLAGIDSLELTLAATATGFRQRDTTIKLAAHGTYALDVTLDPIPPSQFQIVALSASQAQWVGGSTALFSARVASSLDVSSSALVVGEIRDASGTPVATVTPYAEGTTSSQTPAFSFSPREAKTITVPWNTAQQAPGQYRLTLRVVEPGTITAATRLGNVLAENQTLTSVTAKSAIDGAMAITPPLVQAGIQQEVAFSALIRNAGNVPIVHEPVVVTVTPPGSQTVLFSSQADLIELAPGASVNVEFGAWIPSEAGNLEVSVRAQNSAVSGTLSQRLYVGDKADGTFTASPLVVAEGTQNVHGAIDLRGVDTTQGRSTDPLFALVKESVRRGGAYTAPEAANWHRTNRCLGCHIQSQSLLGLSSALQKADIDLGATTFLYNAISTSQNADGALRLSHPEFATTATTLGLWSLAAWPDAKASFRTKYRAAQFMMARKQRSGQQTTWNPDHATGWWNTTVSHTSLVVKGLVDILTSAGNIDLNAVPNYALHLQRALAAGAAPEDVAFGPDAALYLLRGTALSRLDVATGTTTVVASALPSLSGGGLSVGSNGTVYIARASNPTLITIGPSGTRTDLALGGSFSAVAIGPDGSLYFADPNARRIQRRSPAGQLETFATGGLLNRPWGLAFDASGNLMVANRDGYNILKIAPNRTVSIFADGLGYKPIRLAYADDGTLFVTSEGGLLRVHPDGSGEAVLADAALRSIVARDGAIWLVHDTQNNLNTLDNGSMASVDLSAFRNELPFAARYFLSNYRDNSSDNTVHALRLIGMAEAKTQITDSALRTQLDTAVAFEDALIRARQRADGGWGRASNTPSDPLTTAMMGIALEYGSPSADDPKIRTTIQYLLNTQLADGSWDNVQNGLTTRLASTSFVMVFMPKALDRLGGIDVDLQVDFGSDVQLSNPTIVPTSQTVRAQGGISYLWDLSGVTGAGRKVEFDLRLLNMALGEERPVAQSASLEFQNSFVEETIHSPLAVPVVKTARALTLAVTTDKPVYGQHETLLIAPLVHNAGPAAASGTVQLAIQTAGGADTVATLSALPFQALPVAAERLLSATWPTADTLAGSYQVAATLFDAQGRVVDEAIAPFQIVAPDARAGTNVVTDRPLYAAWDVVQITGRAINLAANAVLPPTQAEIIVTSPAGDSILIDTRDLNQIAQSGVVDLPFQLRLADAASGTYQVLFLLHDTFTRTLLSSSQTSFAVDRPATSGLAGEVVVAARQLYVGDPQSCDSSAWTVGAAALAGVRLTHQLVAVAAGTIVQTTPELVDLAGGGERHHHVQTIQTGSLAPGGYSCVLVAESAGVSRPLAFASFELVTPPIDVDATLHVGTRGRLLVLLDPPSADPHGPAGTPSTAAQRTALQQLLTTAGWSYVIVDSAAAFDVEFASGKYALYLLQSEQTKLSEQTQSELREAVFRGEGLVISGSHDERHNRLDDPLGIKLTGNVSAARVVTLTPGNPLGELGSLPLLAGDKALRIGLTTGQSRGRYETTPGAGVCGGTGCDAVVTNAFGRGKGAFAGVDLLAMTARDGLTSAAADLLLALLDSANPVPANSAGAAPVVPVVLELANQGIAVHVTVTITWSSGVTVVDAGGGVSDVQRLVFELDLGATQVASRAFWVRLPPTAGSFALQAAVSAAQGTVTWSGTTDLALAGAAPQTISAIRTTIAALVAANNPAKQALTKADQSLAKVALASRPQDGVNDALKAAEALFTLTDPNVVSVRVAIGLWLRWALQQ